MSRILDKCYDTYHKAMNENRVPTYWDLSIGTWENLLEQTNTRYLWQPATDDVQYNKLFNLPVFLHHNEDVPIRLVTKDS